MGDRSQVCITSGDSKVYLYSHCGGASIYGAAARGMRRAPDRLNDQEYLARVIFCDMVRGDINGSTGYGIGTSAHGDIEHPIPVLDCDSQMVEWEWPRNYAYSPTYPPMPFHEFVAKFDTE